MFVRFGKIALAIMFLFNMASCGKRITYKVEGRIYTNLLHKFSIEFPEKWIVDNSGFMRTLVMFLEPAATKAFTANINIVSEESPLSVDDYVHLSQNSAAKFFDKYEFYGSSSTIINSKEARVLEYSFSQGNGNIIKQKTFTLKNNNEMFVITCSALSTEFNSYVQIFDASANSFKIQE